MTQVLMEKVGENDILVDSTNVVAHQRLGWQRKRITISADGQILEIPMGASVDYIAGASNVDAMTVVHYAITPLAKGIVTVHAAVTLHATDAILVTTGITNPDVARLLTIKGNALNEAGDVVIVGTNINGEAITETIALNGTSEVAGILAFASVTKITLPARTTVGDTVSVGFADSFGMPQILRNLLNVLVKIFDGSTDAGTLTLDADIAKNLYVPAGTPNGTRVLELIYLV